jgi:hypothetical protein
MNYFRLSLTFYQLLHLFFEKRYFFAQHIKIYPDICIQILASKKYYSKNYEDC